MTQFNYNTWYHEPEEFLHNINRVLELSAQLEQELSTGELFDIDMTPLTTTGELVDLVQLPSLKWQDLATPEQVDNNTTLPVLSWPELFHPEQSPGWYHGAPLEGQPGKWSDPDTYVEFLTDAMSQRLVSHDRLDDRGDWQGFAESNLGSAYTGNNVQFVLDPQVIDDAWIEVGAELETLFNDGGYNLAWYQWKGIYTLALDTGYIYQFFTDSVNETGRLGDASTIAGHTILKLSRVDFIKMKDDSYSSEREEYDEIPEEINPYLNDW